MAGSSDGGGGVEGGERPSDDAATDRLLLDAMLGTLATYLRMCGYDAAYVLDDGPDPGDDAVLERLRTEGRTLLTRDEQLAARAPRSVLLAEREVSDQLQEMAAAGYTLELGTAPERCGRCNGRLVAVADAEAVPEYAPDPTEQSLWRCLDCGQVFWKGSHWDDVAARLAGVE